MSMEESSADAVLRGIRSLRDELREGLRKMSDQFDLDVEALTAAVTAVQQEVAALSANTTDPAGLAALEAATANLTALIPVAPAPTPTPVPVPAPEPTPDAPPATS